MKHPFELIKATFVSGMLVILPLGLIVLILLKIAGMLAPLSDPIVELFPYHLRFPTLIVLVLLLFVILFVGLLAQTRAGKGMGNSVENAILNRIPGYSMVRALTRRIGNVEESDKFASALVEIEEALVPAFIVEEHADGNYTVFVPSAPTPAVGTIYIIARERVHIVDASFMKTVKCVSSWGVGSKELVLAMRATDQTEVVQAEGARSAIELRKL
jgi:uncharacterized membrane protein